MATRMLPLAVRPRPPIAPDATYAMPVAAADRRAAVADRPDPGPAPAWMLALVAALTLAHVAAAPFAGLHMDLARDLFVAQEIVAGRYWPAHGPLLAQAFQLGPVWFYAQALGLALTGSLSATATVLVAANSLKIPLAWLLGARLAGPWTGLLWAALIALPGWQALMTVFGLHPGLVEPLALACLLACLGLVRGGGRGWLVAALATLSLALTAHPTAVVLAGFVAVAVTMRWRADGPDLAGLALALAIAALPWLPLVVAAGGDDAAGAGGIPGYLLEQARQVGDLPRRLAGLAEALVLGLPYWLRTVTGLPAPAAAALAAITGVLLVALALLAAPRWRVRPAGRIAAALMVSALALLALRETLPYYHLGAFWVLVCGALALAAAGAAARPAGRTLGVAFAALALVLVVGASAGIIRHQRAGAWPLAFVPMFDLLHASEQPAARAFLMPPLHALDRLGAQLCRTPAASAHGPLANHLFLGYGVEMRAVDGCALPRVGGDGPGLLALPRHMAVAAGAAGAGTLIHSLVPYPPRRMVRASRVWTALTAPVYPPPVPPSGPAGRPGGESGSLSIDLVLADGERVLVSDLLFPAHPGRPEPEAWLDGVPLRAAAGNGGSRLYTCGRATGCAGARLQLTVSGQGLDWIEVLTF